MTRAFRPLVLCYHAVSDSWPHPLAVAPLALERQVRALLARGFRGATAAETLAGRGRLLHVTFDDAYTSVASALPALERLGVPATVFACASHADDGLALAVPELAADAAAYPAELATMNWSKLRELAERGVEIGSHTRTHPHLTRLSSEELDRELRESRARVEDELGRRCRFLAYPYGDEDARVQEAARAAGYEAAFALPGTASPLNVYALPRVGVYRRDGRLRVTLKTAWMVRRRAARLRSALGSGRRAPVAGTRSPVARGQVLHCHTQVAGVRSPGSGLALPHVRECKT